MSVPLVSGWYRWGKRGLFATLILGAAGMTVVKTHLVDNWVSGARKESDVVVDTVERGPFLVTLSVQGHLDSQKNATLVSEVEGTTTIISIVSEGTLVKAGEVVCQLDSSAMAEKAKQQEITVAQADAALTQARENLAIQKTQNESDIAAAVLKLELARLDLKKFEMGEYPKQKNDLEGNVTLAEQNLAKSQDAFEFTNRQVKKGYKTQAELEASRIQVRQDTLKLQSSKEELKVLTVYTKERTETELAANSKELERDLARVKLKSISAEAQAEKEHKSRELTSEIENDKLNKLKRQIAVCTIRAPQDGEVVYANQSSGNGRGGSSQADIIAEGTVVRERQQIINLPDVTLMKVSCRIHESLIGSVKKGLTAKARIDAYPDEVFNGVVSIVASVPMSGKWPNTDLREYDTQIFLTDETAKVSKLRPGLTAQLELLVDSRGDVMQCPIQAVVAAGEKHLVYVQTPEGHRQQFVKTGESNTSHVEIVEGLDVGDKVVMNPRTRFPDEIASLEAALQSEESSRDKQDAMKAIKERKLDDSAPGASKPGEAGRRPGGQGPGNGGGPGGGRRGGEGRRGPPM